MAAAVLRTLLLALALFCAALALLCFVLACAAALHGTVLPALGWLACSALAATAFVCVPALGGVALWRGP